MIFKQANLMGIILKLQISPEKVVLLLTADSELDVTEQIALRLLVMLKSFGTRIRQMRVLYKQEVSI